MNPDKAVIGRNMFPNENKYKSQLAEISFFNDSISHAILLKQFRLSFLQLKYFIFDVFNSAFANIKRSYHAT